MRLSDKPRLDAAPSWTVIAELRQQLNALGERMTAAEDVLDRLGFVSCLKCGNWMKRLPAGEAFGLGGSYWCGQCVLDRLRAMTREDGEDEWGDFLSPGTGPGYVEDLARIARMRGDIWHAACEAMECVGREEAFMRIARELREESR